MKTRITAQNSLIEVEALIANEVTKCEFWGDLGLSTEEFETLSESLRNHLNLSYSGIEYHCKSYPHCMTTYMVFFAVFKYDYNFWGAIADDLGVLIPQNQQESLGLCARRMFDKYSMDYSEAKTEARTNIAPIIYEACIPPDSSLEDLFYILSVDTYHAFDPQLIIDDLIDMRSYAIRKPLLRFLSRFQSDRAIDYMLEVYDAVISSEQRSSVRSRYTESYRIWRENERSKTGISRRKDKDNQAKPFLLFDEGRAGLSIMLPRIIVDIEWLDTAKWIVIANNGYQRIVECQVFGDEGRRYTDTLSVSVPPAEYYTVKLQDSEMFDEKPMKQWEVVGIPTDKPIWFNSNGRQVNANYIMYPYGIFVCYKDVVLSSTKEVNVERQFYPNMTDDYQLACVTPVGSEASIVFDYHGNRTELIMRPQIKMSLIGRHLFGIDDNSLFTDIPQLVIEMEGTTNEEAFELRVGDKSISVLLSVEDTVVNLKDFFKDEIQEYGTYNVRLYQRGRYVKQTEFNYVPAISSNYSPNMCWPANRKELGVGRVLKFKRLSDWEMAFEGCNVNFDEEYYMVDVPPCIGAISISLKSLTDGLSFRCAFDLPINPFEYDILSLQGEIVEKSSKLYKSDIKQITEDELWFSLRTFGPYTGKEYTLAIKNINGIEQRETIRLNNRGSGNLSLSAFYDTIRNSPLPLEIVLICSETPDNYISVAFVSETNSFAKQIKCIHTEKRDYIALPIEIDGKDINVVRFGFNATTIHPLYENTCLTKDGMFRAYPLPEKITEGLYFVSQQSRDLVFGTEDNSFSFQLTNNMIYSKCKRGKEQNVSSKRLLDYLLSDILSKTTGEEIESTTPYEILMSDAILQKVEKVQFDDSDIERLVALAYIANEKIETNKKMVLRKIMRRISSMLMKRGDRYRIIELLTELVVSKEVFDTCLYEYSLLLVYSDSPNRQELAGKVEKYSPELSMILLMSTDGAIRDCMWKERFIEIIGKDAVRHLLSVPDSSNPEETSSEQKKFVREIRPCKVSINLDDQIAGNFEAIQGMITFDKWGNPMFDISKKPDYGIYFGRIKYVDQYVNWYKNTHDRKDEMDGNLRQMMKLAVGKYEIQLLECINELEKDSEMSLMTKKYMQVIEGRIEGNISKTSYAWFFYLQGIAAYLTRLPVGYEVYDKMRGVGIKFMSAASVVAPKLSQRDILMAQVYIYLKRKEENLCQ